ncbi:MAG: FAD/NAD(P)-binding protein, partial [Candidatus Eremiobacteraeota bacterium]|nr:FAD/NAD(P)-binding protein [Candidatus Eremiobacteraeota bacterium]
MRSFTVAIVGGGASGTLVASMLVERFEAAVVILDPCEQLGRGVAYSTDCPRHVLNVPAGKMSAFPSEPDHFVRWLAANVEVPYEPSSFVPRSLYGDYLNGIATAAQATAPDRWRHVKALALDAWQEHDGVRVACSGGDTIQADALVIASGNASPAAWPNVSPEARLSQRYFSSAWEGGARVPDSPEETVLLLGTGLT